LVREVLREALPPSFTGRSIAAPTVDAAAPEVVAIASDADLDAFVRRVARECADPGTRADVAAGRRRFTLAPHARDAARGATAPAAGPAAATAPVPAALRVERGAVTEAHVKQAHRTGVRLVAGPGAVL